MVSEHFLRYDVKALSFMPCLVGFLKFFQSFQNLIKTHIIPIDEYSYVTTLMRKETALYLVGRRTIEYNK